MYRLCLHTQPATSVYSKRTYSEPVEKFEDVLTQLHAVLRINESHMDGYVIVQTDDVDEEFKGQWVQVHRSKYVIGRPSFR